MEVLHWRRFPRNQSVRPSAREGLECQLTPLPTVRNLLISSHFFECLLFSKMLRLKFKNHRKLKLRQDALKHNQTGCVCSRTIVSSTADRMQLCCFCVFCVSQFVLVLLALQGSCTCPCDESAVHSLCVLAAHLGKVHPLLTRPQTRHISTFFSVYLQCKIHLRVNEYFTTTLVL